MKVSQERYLSLLFLHLHLAVTADEMCRRPRPGVLFALRTRVLCFARDFLSPLFLIESVRLNAAKLKITPLILCAIRL